MAFSTAASLFGGGASGNGAAQGSLFGGGSTLFGGSSQGNQQRPVFGAPASSSSQPSSLFGSTSFPSFGAAQQPASGFGSQQPSSLFGQAVAPTPAFGQQPQQTQSQPAMGLFGGVGQTSAAGGFGQSQQQGQSLFGSQQPQPTGLFGASQQQSAPAFGGFGQQPQQQQSNVFGAASTSSGLGFGSSSVGGGTGFGGSGGLFGSSVGSSSTGGGLFGQTSSFRTPAQSTGGLFGAPGSNSGFGQASQGSAPFGGGSSLFGASTTSGTQRPSAGRGTAGVKWEVVRESEGNPPAVAKYNSITMMAAFKSRSLEELRLEDYMAGNRPGQVGQLATGANPFGATQTPGISQSSSLFGQTAPAQNAFGAPSSGGGTGPFGAPSAALSGSGLFGATGFNPQSSNTFGNTGFGSGAPNLFGASASQPSAGFAPNLFGASTQSSFGQQPGSNFGFGSSTASAPSFSGGPSGGTSLFGGMSSSSVAQPTQPSLFGNGMQSQPTLFGNSQPSLFGSTQPSLFGGGSQSSQPSIGFGQTSGAGMQPSLFGGSASSSGFGMSSAGIFGGNGIGSGFSQPNSFGSSSMPLPGVGGGLFGSAPGPASTIGAGGGPNAFGGSSSAGFGNNAFGVSFGGASAGLGNSGLFGAGASSTGSASGSGLGFGMGSGFGGSAQGPLAGAYGASGIGLSGGTGSNGIFGGAGSSSFYGASGASIGGAQPPAGNAMMPYNAQGNISTSVSVPLQAAVDVNPFGDSHLFSGILTSPGTSHAKGQSFGGNTNINIVNSSSPGVPGYFSTGSRNAIVATPQSTPRLASRNRASALRRRADLSLFQSFTPGPARFASASVLFPSSPSSHVTSFVTPHRTRTASLTGFGQAGARSLTTTPYPRSARASTLKTLVIRPRRTGTDTIDEVKSGLVVSRNAESLEHSEKASPFLHAASPLARKGHSVSPSPDSNVDIRGTDDSARRNDSLPGDNVEPGNFTEGRISMLPKSLSADRNGDDIDFGSDQHVEDENIASSLSTKQRSSVTAGENGVYESVKAAAGSSGDTDARETIAKQNHRSGDVGRSTPHSGNHGPINNMNLHDLNPGVSAAVPRLSRSDVYTRPSMRLLQELSEDELARVENFTVGIAGVGEIQWPGESDVRGLDIDRDVSIESREVVVYPLDESRPPLGTGLNKRARISLYGLWKRSKETKEPIKNASGAAAMVKKLKAHCDAEDLVFLGYEVSTGTWTFETSHF